MSKSIEDKPIYRFFNVVSFVVYFLIVVLTVTAAWFGYSEREVISATIECKDGTSWSVLEPTDIRYNSSAKCGLCTKRTPDNQKYENCSYDENNFQFYKINEEKVAFNWETIVYPLVVFILGFGFVDFIRLSVLYIFTGEILFQKSLIIKMIVALNTSGKTD